MGKRVDFANNGFGYGIMIGGLTLHRYCYFFLITFPLIEGVCKVNNDMNYYKKRNKVSNKSFNKSVDSEITRLESQRKPRVKRNGKVIDKSEDITSDIQELNSLKQNKRRILKLHKETNKLSTEFFNSSCVYRLWEGSKLVYVGQTNNLAYRIGQHLKDKSFTSFDVYAHIENDSVRLNVERRLIETHKPQYNVQHNK